MILETIVVGLMQVNCYILAEASEGQAIIIDPGAQERKIQSILKRHSLKVALIVNTHGHYDHIGCDDKFGVPVYIHTKDMKLLKDPQFNLSSLFALPFKVSSEIRCLEDNQHIGIGGIELKALHIPGHTPGGLALLMLRPQDNVLFTGDTLFCQGIGRSDITGGDQQLLIRSIKEKFLTLPDSTIVYPGHGPATNIGEEKKGNPFLV